MKKLILFILRFFKMLFGKKQVIEPKPKATPAIRTNHTTEKKINYYPPLRYRETGRIEHKIPDVAFSFIKKDEKHEAHI